VSRHPARHGHQLAGDHHHPVVVAGNEALDDDAAAVLAGHLEGPADLLLGRDVDGDSPPVVGVERLHHHRIADPLRRRDRVVLPLHQPLTRHRQPQVGQDPIGLLLVGGELDRDVRGAAGDGRLHPLLVTSVAQLDQALLVEPDPGDPPLLRRAHQRHGARAQRPALGEADELVPLGGEVEVRRHRARGPELGRQQRVEQGEPEAARLEPDVLLLVLIDDVILPGLAVRAGLAEGHRLAGDVLQLDRHVLEDVAHPGALVLDQPPDEAARLAVGAAVLVQPGERRDEGIGERLAQPTRGPLLQLAQVHVEADDRKVGVEAGPDIDRFFDDAHAGSSVGGSGLYKGGGGKAKGEGVPCFRRAWRSPAPPPPPWCGG
jgi:hypothetical protein